MVARARLSVIELRRSTRHSVRVTLPATHRERGGMAIHVANISANGFMAEGSGPFALGDRIVLTLPHVARIEAHCMWLQDERFGFQFERILREDELTALLTALRPPPHARIKR